MTTSEAFITPSFDEIDESKKLLVSVLSRIRKFTRYDANDLLETKRLLANTAIE